MKITNTAAGRHSRESIPYIVQNLKAVSACLYKSLFGSKNCSNEILKRRGSLDLSFLKPISLEEAGQFLASLKGVGLRPLLARCCAGGKPCLVVRSGYERNVTRTPWRFSSRKDRIIFR
jgi:hypothetical protein